MELLLVGINDRLVKGENYVSMGNSRRMEGEVTFGSYDEIFECKIVVMHYQCEPRS